MEVALEFVYIRCLGREIWSKGKGRECFFNYICIASPQFELGLSGPSLQHFSHMKMRLTVLLNSSSSCEDEMNEYM